MCHFSLDFTRTIIYCTSMLKQKNGLKSKIAAARRVSVPIVAITSQDQIATIQSIATNGTLALKAVPEVPILTWDIVRGILALNDAGKSAHQDMLGDRDQSQTTNLVEALNMALDLPQGSALLLCNVHRVLDMQGVSQAILNLRDPFKKMARMLILLGPDISLPAELVQDVIIFDDPLPTREEIGGIVDSLLNDAGVKQGEEERSRAVEALTGLAAFPAEQVAVMSLSRAGIDIGMCWERKRKQVEQTKGLSMPVPAVKFADLGGLAQIKEDSRLVMSGPAKADVVVWIDEIEKLMAGAGGDTSGVSQDQLGVVLRWMESPDIIGGLLLGPPGCSKSYFCQAFAGEFDTPLVSLDFGAAKGSLVGQSEGLVRACFKTISAIGKRIAVFATCNRLESLPPEFRRRFRVFGIRYFDLPDAQERTAIWTLQLQRYGLPADGVGAGPEGWSAANIRDCCEIMWATGRTLSQAAQSIVPAVKQDGEGIKRLRDLANGRFLSVSYPGAYHLPERQESGRKLEL